MEELTKMFESGYNSAVIKLLIAVIVLSVFYVKRAYGYWARRSVPYLKPTFPFGNFKTNILQKITIGESMIKFYNELKSPGRKFGGVYRALSPQLVILDPELARTILSKNFQSFQDRPTFCDEEYEPLTAHLFHLRSNEWRNLRRKLTPTFTSGKMKMMFQTLLDCSNELEVILNEHASEDLDLDIKEMMARFTTDIIGSCAFGVECNSLKNPDAEFRYYGRTIFDLSALKSLQLLILHIMPKLGKFLGLKRLDKDTNDFFMKTVKEMVDYREKNGVTRKDFLQLLIGLKKNGDEDGLTIEQIAAQCFVFFVAGFETSSTTMTYFMYKIASRPDIQDKCRQEINETIKRYDGKLTYEGVMELQYLEQTIYESMRLHPPIPFIFRCCTKNYQLPDSDVVIEKGTNVWIPTDAYQHDPEIFPNPQEFDPERFSKEEKAKRHPYTFLPFGEGPRNCIGSRFGLMQTKVGLAMLLKNHRFTLSPKTKIPVKYDAKQLIYTAEGGVWLKVQKI